MNQNTRKYYLVELFSLIESYNGHSKHSSKRKDFFGSQKNNFCFIDHRIPLKQNPCMYLGEKFVTNMSSQRRFRTTSCSCLLTNEFYKNSLPRLKIAPLIPFKCFPRRELYFREKKAVTEISFTCHWAGSPQ